MRIVFENEVCVVIDDFLSPTDFKTVWNYIQDEDYRFAHANKWTKAFRLSDGQPLQGPVYLSNDYEKDKISTIYPSNKGIDIIIQKIISEEKFLSKWVGQRDKDWAYFFSRAYLYPANTGLSWHRDNKYNATGAHTFYCHPEWNVQWGGELFIAEASTRNFEFPETTLYNKESKFIGSHLNNSIENEKLFEYGVGHYILPKPNRFVALTSGVLHAIKKVDPAAGNKIRASIQGFFMHPNKSVGE